MTFPDDAEAVDYRRIFEEGPYPIFVFATESLEILDANQAAIDAYGYSKEELLRMKVPDLRPPEDVPGFVATYAETLRTTGAGPSMIPGLLRHRKKDGTIVLVQIWRIRVSLRERMVSIVLVVDVTAQEGAAIARTEVQRTEQRFRALIEHSSDAIALLDEAGTVTYVSPSTSRTLGYQPEDLVGIRALELVHAEDSSAVAAVRERVTATPGLTMSVACRMRHADGSWRWMEGVATNLLEEPTVRAIVCNYRDFTERKVAEDALRESEERYRGLFDATPVPVFVFDDATLAYLAVNDVAVRHYGYSREEFLRMTVRDIRPAEDIPLLEQTIAKLPPSHARLGVWRHRKRDGTVFDVEIASHPIVFGGKRARLVTAQDITERSRLEEQLRQSQKMEAIGLLAGGIAHDFNNLLSVILGGTELAQRAMAQGKSADESLAGVAQAALRASELTRKLLAFSRKQVLRVRTIDLHEALEDFAKLLLRVVGEDIEFGIRRTKERLVLRADASQLEQVLLNLCTNARHAMPRGGRLLIETRRASLDAAFVAKNPWARQGEYAELRVVDSGVGMDDVTLARIFEPFFTTKEEGTGLGLAMVYGIVQQHHGCLHVESEPGRGTTARVFLPLVTDMIDDVPTLRTAAELQGGNETLLLAEDEAPLRNLLATTLSSLGYTVILADNGEEATRAFEERPDAIDLVILDVVMPKLGGPETYQRMNAIRPGVRVLFTTGYAPETSQMAELIAKEGHVVLDKPFELRDLAVRVRQALEA